MTEDMRKVFVRDYVLDLIIGVHEHERVRSQPVLVSVELYLDAKCKPQSDNLEEVFNYERIAEAIEQVAALPSMDLVETFADRLVDAYFKDVRVGAVRVRVEKTQILAKAKGLGFEVFRKRSGS